MFRTSSLLTIALGLAAFGSATVPAAAWPVSTGVQPSQQASHLQSGPSIPAKSTILGPIKTVPIMGSQPVKSASTTVGNAIYPMPKTPGVSTTVGNSKYPLPKLSPGGSTTLGPGQFPAGELPLPPPPKIGNGVDNVCPDNPYKCPPKQGGNTGGQIGSNQGPVVILAPQVPVAVPIAVPVRVGTGITAAAQARPASQNCGTAATIPTLAAGIDELLPTARLSESDMIRVTSLRQLIQELSTDRKEAAARDAEEIAMNLLGYQKVWLSCGIGFNWIRQAVSAEAAQPR